MIGTPTRDTTHMITYVPGTFTDLDSVYTGQVQDIANYLVNKEPGTVAFVYKDGEFPGENDRTDTTDMLRLGEANDPQIADAAGDQLARFQAGIDQNRMLSAAEQDAVGHSWGLTDITASETSGADYDKVVSLSGAWMPEDWHPDRRGRAAVSGTKIGEVNRPDWHLYRLFDTSTGGVASWLSDTGWQCSARDSSEISTRRR